MKQVLSGLKYNILFHVHGLSSPLHDMDLKSTKRVFQTVPAGSSIIATIPYRVVNMELKKIMALAMLALMVIPSLTMVVRADDPTVDPEEVVGLAEGVDLAGAIERARTYLDNVRDSAETLADEYPGDVMMQGYLNDIYELLGQDEFFLEATGDVGDEDRIVIPMPLGFTLGELNTISWREYLVKGYPPHVDVFLDMGDSLNFEYAYNTETHYGEGQITGDTAYGALKDAWYATFSDDENGPVQINADAKAWPNSGPPGPPGSIELHTLANWQSETGVTYTTNGEEKTINADSVVTKLEIEVDNWIVQTEAYVDDIKINGVTYDFEGGAEGFLNRALEYHGEGDFNSAARNLAAARNILGRVKGLLNSMVRFTR